MSENNANNCAEIGKEPVQADKKEEEEETKQFYRDKVWKHLEKNKLSDNPRPIRGRIPNFKQSQIAANKLLDLEEFQKAEYIEINPDKPQEAARFIALQNRKELYVPIPRLKNGFLKHFTVPEDDNEIAIKRLITRKGLEYNGTAIDVKTPLTIDLLIVGSVAVSKTGQRIGKGRGYADLEYAILTELKAVNSETVIVTNVDDSQVFDSFPSHIIQAFDVPVDIIITPTQIIRVEKRLPRPSGIIWNLISSRKLKLMSVLQTLKEIQESEGKTIELKSEDTDIETFSPRRRPRYIKKFRKRIPRTKSETSESKDENIKPKRFSRRRKITNTSEVTENGENGKNNNNRNVKFRRFRKKLPIDFSLMLSNIEKNLRVRELKDALNKEGVKPNDITWRGFKGYCYLHYAKPKAIAENPSPIVADNVIQILQNLKINPESDLQFDVKVMEPISRIETTNITAV